jgi:hypothetical protein
MTWPTKTDFVDGDVLTAAQVNNIGTNLNIFDPTSATNGQVPIANGSGSAAWGSIASGLSIMKPTSVAVGGGTATINTDGSVSFSAVTSTLSLNGVFTADYANYLVMWYCQLATTAGDQGFRLRAAGSDSSSSYTYQRMSADSTTIAGARTTGASYAQFGWGGSTADTSRNCGTITLFGPQQATQTTGHASTQSGYNTFTVAEFGWNHSPDTSYDGFTWLVNTLLGGNMTGLITVYGMAD